MGADKKLVKERYQIEKKVAELTAQVTTAQEKFDGLKREILDFSSLPYQDALILKRNYTEAWSALGSLQRKLKHQRSKLKAFAENYPEIMKEKISEKYLLESRRGA